MADKYNGQSQAKQMEAVQDMGGSEDDKASSQEGKLEICKTGTDPKLRRASSGSIGNKSRIEVR